MWWCLAVEEWTLARRMAGKRQSFRFCDWCLDIMSSRSCIRPPRQCYHDIRGQFLVSMWTEMIGPCIKWSFMKIGFIGVIFYLFRGSLCYVYVKMEEQWAESGAKLDRWFSSEEFQEKKVTWANQKLQQFFIKFRVAGKLNCCDDTSV